MKHKQLLIITEMREAVICIRTRDRYAKRFSEAKCGAHRGLLWSSVLVQSNEHNIVIFSVLVDFVFVSEVRYYLRIDKSLLCQIRENPPHIRVGLGQLKRFHNRGGRLTRNSIHGLRGTMTAKQFEINKKLGLNTDMSVRVLTKEDIIEIIKYLIRLINSKATVDDIDHLSNRRVRTL